MPKLKGFARAGVKATLPRRIAEEGERRECTMQSGHALCEWVAEACGRHPLISETGPTGRWLQEAQVAKWLKHWLGPEVAGWRPTCTDPSVKGSDIRSNVFIGDVRIANGRGSRLFDVVLLDKAGKLTPASLKGGKTASDFGLGLSKDIAKALVDANAPIWLGVVESESWPARQIEYVTGEELNLPVPDGIKVTWYNLTPVLKRLPSWDEECESACGVVRMRPDARDKKVDDGIVGRTVYLRLNVRVKALKPFCETLDVSPDFFIPGHGWQPETEVEVTE